MPAIIITPSPHHVSTTLTSHPLRRQRTTSLVIDSMGRDPALEDNTATGTTPASTVNFYLQQIGYNDYPSDASTTTISSATETRDSNHGNNLWNGRFEKEYEDGDDDDDVDMDDENMPGSGPIMWRGNGLHYRSHDPLPQ